MRCQTRLTILLVRRGPQLGRRVTWRQFGSDANAKYPLNQVIVNSSASS